MLAKGSGNKPSLTERINEHLKVKRPKVLKARKLSYFSDGEGKTRVIGVIDYWTQSALKPIHDNLNDILKRIPEDCTFDQNAFYSKLKNSQYYYSFDLSNATDRLPVSIQADLIAEIYSKKIAVL